MCVLEGFRFLKMCLYMKDRVFLESCAFVYNRGEKHSLSVRYFGSEFDSANFYFCFYRAASWSGI